MAATGMNLTEGAISRITSGGATAAEFKPTLQVTELKLVSTSKQQQQQQSERFRLVLSDGSHLQQAMLGTQINHLVKDGNLRSGSVVRLIQYTCTTVQERMIVIVLELVVIAEECALIGNPVPTQKYGRPLQSSPDQQGTSATNGQSSGGTSLTGSNARNQNLAAPSLQGPRMNQPNSNSHSSSYDMGRYGATNAPPFHPKEEPGAGFHGSSPLHVPHSNQNSGFHNTRPVSQPLLGTYSRPAQSSYQQPPPMYTNRGPVAKNEAPPRIIPIAALNPYQGRWTIKARVTAKGELRHYNNARGDGKVFSFDLLDADGGEIRVTCFNAVADQFFGQIEIGRVYMVSRGSLKPAQKNFNHLHNDLELLLDNSSTIQPCFEDDNAIPRQQFHFRPISEVESMDNNSVMDVIGVVTSITPTASIMRKNGTETQKRTLHLKDMSGRSVELTLWGNFCNAQGQRIQDMCDSGDVPVLAVKSGRVNDFNGKAVGTISSSQLFIEPDFPEAHTLKEWFDKEGRNTPSVSISREISSMGRADVLKTISQIKDEKLGTSDKPDWITVSATVIFVKSDNFCYTACPIMVGDRPCNKKVSNNGDGKWRCEKCDQSVDECDYRYILQLQIQDHTGITWVTAFQECGEEIMGTSAKHLYGLKYENQEDDEFSKILRQVLFTRYLFKLKVKEETFSDEQRVKSTVVKAERVVNYSSHSRSLLDMMEKCKLGNSTSFINKAQSNYPNPLINNTGSGNFVSGQSGPPGSATAGNSTYTGRALVIPGNQGGQSGNQYETRFSLSSSSGSYLSCSSCGATGHASSNCPAVAPGQSVGGNYANRVNPGVGSSGATGECFKCHQVGHWARDCPGLSTVPSNYGGSGMPSGRYGGFSKQQVGGF